MAQINQAVNSDLDNSVNYSEMVRNEIDTINAFKTAQGQLVSQYGNLLEKLYEYAPVIVMICDISSEDGHFIYINKFAQKELGYEVHEMLTHGDKFFASAIHPEDNPYNLSIYYDFINKITKINSDEGDKIVDEQVKRIKHLDGRFIWFNIRTTILSRKSDGSPHLVLTIMSNVNDNFELQVQKQKTLNLEISLLKEKVKSQNDQLQTQLLSSIENDKCYDDVIKYVKHIADNIKDHDRHYYDMIINYISRNKPSENVWDDFVQRFHDINPNFVTVLSERFPDLTPTELKICSLTRTGLNSKDIASILKISIRSVENHKYNIRRKFGLEPYQNLYNFINSVS